MNRLFRIALSLMVFLPVIFSCKKDNTSNSDEEKPQDEQVPEQPVNPDAANCYLVTKPGSFSFPTYKGNSFIPVGDVASVEILWESYGTGTAPYEHSLISYLAYSSGNEEGQAGTISCTVPSPMKNGNAVVAAKDENGKILWSWHIWLCKDYDPDETAQSYYNDAGVMMDRNLGATSATPGDVGALGLLYQWGRKDPFLGSSSISASTQAASTGEWSKTWTNETIGTIEYTIEHPMTFIASGLQNGDWLYGKSEWYRTYSTDFTRWGAKKTIYDPCPKGWRVPDEAEKNEDNNYENIWSKTLGSFETFTWGYDLENLGINFYHKFGDKDPIWYPLAGYIHGTSGQQGVGLLLNVKNYGFWWTCGGNTSLYIEHYNVQHIRPSWTTWSRHCYGCSVRCQRDPLPEAQSDEQSPEN